MYYRSVSLCVAAIRSGDYYLFDDDSEDEAPDQADTLTFGQDTDDTGAKMGPLQVGAVLSGK